MHAAVEVAEEQGLPGNVHKVYVFCIDDKASAQAQEHHPLITELFADSILYLSELICHKTGFPVRRHHVRVVAVR